jgi:hypothetical protein
MIALSYASRRNGTWTSESECALGARISLIYIYEKERGGIILGGVDIIQQTHRHHYRIIIIW